MNEYCNISAIFSVFFLKKRKNLYLWKFLILLKIQYFGDGRISCQVNFLPLKFYVMIGWHFFSDWDVEFLPTPFIEFFDSLEIFDPGSLEEVWQRKFLNLNSL